ncbi:MAG: hypothetical protein DMG34_20450 [Acidobacteria bacterium]|nr:MAG: hypothetical protein DMG34_20450 [Acidobacteriota bacterium]
MRKPPSPSTSDLKSFATYRDWRTRTQGIAIPEAEWRNDFAENPDGSVGERITPAFVPQAIMAVGYAHDYDQIRVPVLAFVGYPPLPQDQIRQAHITEPAERVIIEAVFGTSVGMIKNRIKRIERAGGSTRVIELWDANHFVFLSNEAEVLLRYIDSVRNDKFVVMDRLIQGGAELDDAIAGGFYGSGELSGGGFVEEKDYAIEFAVAGTARQRQA